MSRTREALRRTLLFAAAFTLGWAASAGVLRLLDRIEVRGMGSHPGRVP